MKKIIDQMDEKITSVLSGLKGEFSITDFVAAFQKKYPKDWERLEERLKLEDKNAPFRQWKKGPMPTPEKYIVTALKDFAKRNEKVINRVDDDRFKKTV